ncbi:hypothetical protein KKH36_01715 [Patescibacteria group bacterium]|nr:hypothetical protein [Patescibacteria group bacterium]
MIYNAKNKDLIISDEISHTYADASLFVNDIDNLLDRKKSIESHIEKGDYFGTLATILDLIEQITEKEIKSLNINKDKFKAIKQIKKIKKDLIFIQKNYKILKK